MPLDNPLAARLEDRLRRELRGEVLFDRFSSGRYSTDASVYQIEPLGVAVPRDRLKWRKSRALRGLTELPLRLR